MAKISITECAQPFSCTRSVIIQGNITAMRYQNDVIRLILLLHIHENLGMMLGLSIMSRG